MAGAELLTDDAILFQKVAAFDTGAKALLLSNWMLGPSAGP
jgi:hypothetical protein